MEEEGLELSRQVAVDFEADADFHQRRSRPRHEISSCSCRRGNYSSAAIAAQTLCTHLAGQKHAARGQSGSGFSAFRRAPPMRAPTCVGLVIGRCPKFNFELVMSCAALAPQLQIIASLSR